MRLSIVHETAYRYKTPASRAIEVLKLTPRGHDSQYVVNWRIDVDKDCRLDATADPFGNVMHSFTVEGPLDGLVITAEGEVDIQDNQGVLSGTVERFPPSVFLRDTTLTTSDAAIRTFADGIAAKAKGDRLAFSHALTQEIRGMMRFDVDATDTGTSATESFAHRHGVCQDFAHVFLASARHVGIPARYVSGYLFRADRPHGQEAGHAWAEAYIDGFGWVGFDPANGISPTDAYVRVAIGLDYLGAAPIRGTRYGGSGEELSVRIHINQSNRQSQSQSQRG
jgi:transglutaminase-like putative cysteine protease